MFNYVERMKRVSKLQSNMKMCKCLMFGYKDNNLVPRNFNTKRLLYFVYRV